MRSKYLKYFYVLDTIGKDVKDNPDYKNNYLPKLFYSLKYNKVMRKLSFAKPSNLYYEIRDDIYDENNDEYNYEDNNEDDNNYEDENNFEDNNKDDDYYEGDTEEIEKDGDKYNENDDSRFHNFRYIKKQDYNSVIFLIKAMKKLFGKYEGNKKNKVDNLIRKIIMYRFSNYRKLVVG